jgi:hypothetical protein
MSVVDIEAVRIERIANELVEHLRANGSVKAALADVEDVDRWRRGARRAARELGWRIRTGVSSESVWAVSENWLPGPGADWRAARRFAELIVPRGTPPLR